MSHYESGLAGETLAEQYLLVRGFTLIARRFRSPHGEIDLVMKKGGVLFFVEVKYRPNSPLGAGLCSITRVKKARLQGAAKAYLKDSPAKYKLSYLEITRAGVHFTPDVLHET